MSWTPSRSESKWPIDLAKKAYVEGKIDLPTLERALEDRLQGNSFKHDARIEGDIPPAARGDDYDGYGYRDDA